MPILMICRRVLPSAGKYLKEGIYECFNTREGLPAIKYQNEEILIIRSHKLIFGQEIAHVAEFSSEAANLLKEDAFSTRISGTRFGAVGGLLGSVVSSAVGAVAGRATKDAPVSACAFVYLNNKQREVGFIGIATPIVMNQILASIPKDRFRDPRARGVSPALDRLITEIGCEP